MSEVPVVQEFALPFTVATKLPCCLPTVPVDGAELYQDHLVTELLTSS